VVLSVVLIEIERTIDQLSPQKISGKIQSIFSELERALKDATPSEVLFKESFTDLSYKSSEQGRKLIKYVLGRINNYLQKTDELIIDFDRVNIEHILPQNPSKEWNLSKKEIKSYVNQIGNLTLLSKVINSKIQNGPIVNKIIELEKSELSITQALVSRLKELIELNHDWDKGQIEKRQSEFAGLAYNNIWTL